ncbi:hypothetical protein VP01_2540g1 [Puccinia sorghi]|uniref:Uncharacterized protein n=1 Tax=Puccinia sorghi TaxID=27349 RepID=A0A0L6V5A7_9BASI|nr:hypothetical protein VP01_2540g1 [Puccinia sorghi]
MTQHAYKGVSELKNLIPGGCTGPRFQETNPPKNFGPVVPNLKLLRQDTADPRKLAEFAGFFFFFFSPRSFFPPAFLAGAAPSPRDCKASASDHACLRYRRSPNQDGYDFSGDLATSLYELEKWINDAFAPRNCPQPLKPKIMPPPCKRRKKKPLNNTRPPAKRNGAPNGKINFKDFKSNQGKMLIVWKNTDLSLVAFKKCCHQSDCESSGPEKALHKSLVSHATALTSTSLTSPDKNHSASSLPLYHANVLATSPSMPPPRVYLNPMAGHPTHLGLGAGMAFLYPPMPNMPGFPYSPLVNSTSIPSAHPSIHNPQLSTSGPQSGTLVWKEKLSTLPFTTLCCCNPERNSEYSSLSDVFICLTLPFSPHFYSTTCGSQLRPHFQHLLAASGESRNYATPTDWKAVLFAWATHHRVNFGQALDPARF